MKNQRKIGQLNGLVISSALGLGLLLISNDSAQAVSFNWSFSNVIGGIGGTVSGTLEVPEGNDVAASSVILTETTNPVFDSLVGLDFTTLSIFSNRFNVSDGKITAAFFGTDFFSNDTNLSLELNSEQFGDDNSENLGLLTIAGNPLPVNEGGDGICPAQCLQTAPLLGSNSGEEQFAPNFTPIPESSPVVGLLTALGLVAGTQLRKSIIQR